MILNDFMGNKRRQWPELVGIFTKMEFRITDGKSGLYVQSDNSYAPAVWDWPIYYIWIQRMDISRELLDWYQTECTRNNRQQMMPM